MRFRLRYLAGLSLSLLALTLSGGCSRQGEGDRCDFDTNGNADCDDGLVCIKSTLLLSNDKADRCCPASGSASDSRCALNTGSTGSGGSGGSDAGSIDSGQAGSP
jgi:hypothetical protein